MIIPDANSDLSPKPIERKISMKNNRCFRLPALLLAIIMILTAVPLMAAVAAGGTSSGGVGGFVILQTTNLNDGFVKSVQIVDAKGEQVADLATVDPNGPFTLKLSIQNPADAGDDASRKLPEDPSKVRVYYQLENMTAKAGSNNKGVSWTFDAETKQIVFTWTESGLTAFDADISITPAYPTDNDLSGSYILGTAGQPGSIRNLMTSEPFMDGKRGRLRAIAYSEENDMVYPWNTSTSISVWELKHVSGNYYTLRATDKGQYLKIVPSTNGVILESVEEADAQKILVESAGNGYYMFSYQNKSLNNSSFSAIKGFASYAKETGGNAILKLYDPSKVMTDAKHDVSGTWVIANATRKNILTAGAQSSNRLAAVSFSKDGEYLLTTEEVSTFTFERIIRDWYTVKTDGGYLNISSDGAYISATPQPLMVQTDRNFNSIILVTSEIKDQSYTLNNINGATKDGYGSNAKITFNDNSRVTLYPAANVLNEGKTGRLVFNINGGTAESVPETVIGEIGDTVILPELNASKDGAVFVGWMDVSDLYKVVPGTNHRYHEIYKPGTSYKLTSNKETLYAIYNTSVKTVRFGIRKDGVIQDEPNDNKTSDYIGHFTVQGILKENYWVIDIDSTKPVNGYYVQNNVTANLNWVPSADEIAEALKKEGNVDFDPETQYIHYYVMKCTGVDVWKVDGVIRNKTNVEITYNMNVPGTEGTTVKGMPSSYQVAKGTEILVGSDKDGTEILRPTRSGYLFNGWNSAADGSGTKYAEGHYLELDENLNLYAQWIDVSNGQMVIRIESSWPDNKPSYYGTEITMTAQLTGFENRTYTLQWQYKTADSDWIDIPNANGVTYTYYLDDINTNYTWRCIAKDVR